MIRVFMEIGDIVAVLENCRARAKAAVELPPQTSADDLEEAVFILDAFAKKLTKRGRDFRAALEEIASHETGMRPDLSVGARQAAIARSALVAARKEDNE